VRKIRSGIFGLNQLLDGGLNENSTTVVIGRPGTGKTTLATQFIRRGLQDGQEGIYVSLDENKEQIIREAIEMGWTDILDYLKDELLVFIDASGREFSTFIRQELPSFVSDWGGAKARIAIDPLTPVAWATKDPYEQRDLISFLLKQTRKIGTVVAALEEHGASDLTGLETVIPMYLADGVIHLRYESNGKTSSRTMKIVKCRSSRHSSLVHPYHIVRGLGLLVEPGPYHKPGGQKLATQARELLATRPALKPVAARLDKLLGGLADEDLQNLTVEQLVDLLSREYGEG